METKVSAVMASEGGRLLIEAQTNQVAWKLDLCKMALRGSGADAEGIEAITAEIDAVAYALGGIRTTDCVPLAKRVRVLAFAVCGLAGDDATVVEDGLEDAAIELAALSHE